MTKKLKYVFLFLGLLLTIILITVGMKYWPGAQEESKKVSLRLKWINQAQFSGFYMANKLGFYAENGLDVGIYPGGPDISPVQMVVTGVNDFGITGADQILLAREKGVPIVALAVIYKQSPVAIDRISKGQKHYCSQRS
ncbi:MAG: ABC transporter substrate-binding protein [bacterium]|nr:ABC transporter substrate-binding protein [bacterium]